MNGVTAHQSSATDGAWLRLMKRFSVSGVKAEITTRKTTLKYSSVIRSLVLTQFFFIREKFRAQIKVD